MLPRDKTETLDDLNLSRMMSHRWRVISHCLDDWLREYLEKRLAVRRCHVLEITQN